LSAEEDLATDDKDSLIALPDSMDHNGLVDLIDQPAWKTILIELVKKERVDPWSIDIGVLAGMYLAKINSLTGTDLRLPANAILASAILLKFKSNVLKISNIEDEDEFLEKKKGMSPDEKAEFDALLPDLKNIHRIKEGKVSLDDLVASIESMLSKSKKTRDKKFLGRERTEFKIPLSDFQIDKEMDKVFKIIQKTADSQGLVLFSEIIKGKDGDTVNVVRTFLPCLFLTNKGRINMWQDDFFGSIFISLNKDAQK